MFSRIATYSISGVMMPRRAYSSCVTHWPFRAQHARLFRKGRRQFFFADVAVVFRLHVAAVDLFDVAARFHPFGARAGEARIDVDGDGGIGVGAAGIVDRRPAVRWRSGVASTSRNGTRKSGCAQPLA
jgi:hypothetical protein